LAAPPGSAAPVGLQYPSRLLPPETFSLLASTGVTTLGTDPILNLPATFKAAYDGGKNSYMYAAGASASQFISHDE
jgi:hypothetical protein